MMLAAALRTLALVLVAALAQQAAGEARLALVVGNGAYATLPLANPANDATLMKTTLESVGFEVALLRDANQGEMRDAIDRLQDNLLAAGDDATGVFFFAGHGVRVADTNYLLPVDAAASGRFDIGKGVSAFAVVDGLRKAGNRLNLVFLDACRDAGALVRASGRGHVGLAEMDAPPGTLISFATAPGIVAFDGDGRNSPYTGALARNMREKGVRLTDVLRGVREDVERATNGVQSPEERSGLGRGRFYFVAPDGIRDDPDFAPQAPTEGWVVANGSAGLDAGLAVAKRQAMFAATQRAISIATGSSSATGGYVRDFDIRRQGVSPDGDEYRVEMHALVEELNAEAGDEALSRHVALLGSPKVLFVMSERGEREGLEVESRGLWHASAAEQVMAQEFRRAGYRAFAADEVVDTGFVDADDVEKARSGVAAYAARAGRAMDADVVVVGTVRYETRRMAIPNSDLEVAVADVALIARAVVPSTGNVMETYQKDHFDRDPAGSMLRARERALAGLSKLAATELKWTLPFRLADEPRAVTLEIVAPSLVQAQRVGSFIEGLAGVHSSEMHGWQAGVSRYAVKLRQDGPRGYELAGALSGAFSGLRIQGASTFEVQGAFN